MTEQQYNEALRYEYDSVTKRSRYPDLIAKAIRTPITQHNAEMLIRHYVPNSEVVFYPDIRSEAVRTWHETEEYYHIRLCSNPLTPADIETNQFYPRLHLGVVLHEVAHIKAGLWNHHNSAFVSQLDSLLSESFEGDEVTNYEAYIAEENQKWLESRKKPAKALKDILKGEKCEQCGKPAVEKQGSIKLELGGKLYITLECGHVTTKDKMKLSPVDEFVSINNEHLYDFQKESVEMFGDGDGKVIYAHEMGLGKTPIAIANIKLYNLFPFVWVCKAALSTQAQRMMWYWGQIDDIQVIKGSKDIILPGMQGYIIPYDTLARMKDPAATFKRFGIKCIVFDEFQAIKNPEAKRTRAATMLATVTQKIQGLSGSPIKNNAAEYYPTLHMLRPNLFRSFAAFVSAHVDVYRRGMVIKYGGLKNPAKFKELTQDFILRYTQAEVLPDLPPIRRNMIYVDVMEGELADEYEEATDAFTDWYFKNQTEGLGFFQNILEYFTKMRHITGRAKCAEAFEWITNFVESTGRKVIVFTHHIDVRKKLVEELNVWCKENELGEVLELGAVNETSQDKRDQTQTLFNTSEAHKILIASTLASGEGLNLQAQCSDLLMLERQWNAMNEVQAEFRVKRPGQKASVINSNYLIATGTIDEDLTQIVEKKRALETELSGERYDFNQNEILKSLAEVIAKRSISKIGAKP